MPAGMPAGSHFKGTRALVTGSQVVINGSGRINNWNIYSDPYYKFGAHNQKQGGTAHDDVASNIYYTIGSDILTVSSTHTPEPADTFKDAIIAASFTSAWPVIKGLVVFVFRTLILSTSSAQQGPHSKVQTLSVSNIQCLQFKESSVLLKTTSNLEAGTGRLMDHK